MLSHLIGTLEIVERELLAILEMSHSPEQAAELILVGEVDYFFLIEDTMLAHEFYVVVGGVFGWWCPSVYFSGNCGTDKDTAVLLYVGSHDDECCTDAMEDVLELFEVFVFGEGSRNSTLPFIG